MNTSSTGNVAQVADFFLSRHIWLKDEWLQTVVQYIQSSQLRSKNLSVDVFHQWLYSDISQSTNSSFQWSSANSKEIRGYFIFQVMSVTDIGSSSYSQKRAKNVKSDDFSFFDGLSSATEEVPKEVQYEKKANRMLMLLLSDGTTTVKSIEYKRIPHLSKAIVPGAKIILYGVIQHKNRILWLTPWNCQLLGGDGHAKNGVIKENLNISVSRKPEMPKALNTPPTAFLPSLNTSITKPRSKPIRFLNSASFDDDDDVIFISNDKENRDSISSPKEVPNEVLNPASAARFSQLNNLITKPAMRAATDSFSFDDDNDIIFISDDKENSNETFTEKIEVSIRNPPPTVCFSPPNRSITKPTTRANPFVNSFTFDDDDIIFISDDKENSKTITDEVPNEVLNPSTRLSPPNTSIYNLNVNKNSLRGSGSFNGSNAIHTKTAPTSMVVEVADFFLSRHIWLKDEWLQTVVQYIQSSQLRSKNLSVDVFHQWLYSDISQSTNSSFQWSSANSKEIRGYFIFQVMSVTDIGSSSYSQKHAKNVKSDDFSFFDGLSSTTEEVPKEVQYEKKANRMLMLLLSDGTTTVKSIEYKRIPHLSKAIVPGAKIILYGSIQHKNRILWLTPWNCQLLGGEVLKKHM